MASLKNRPQFSKNMDPATKAYFKSGDHAFTARDDKAIGTRGDLSTAFYSDRGRKLRRYLAEKGIVSDFGRIPQGMERAIATTALWMHWKERQTGKPVRPEDLPMHCLPVAGPVRHGLEAAQ